MKQGKRFIGKLIDGTYEGAPSEEQSAAVVKFVNPYMDLEGMERTQLYLRGHTDAFAYLKKINVL